MTASVTIEPAQGRAWLRDLDRRWRGPILRASLISLADVVAAIGFAAGLALVVTGAAADPARSGAGVALAVLSLALRGGLGLQAATAGARLARGVKAQVRGLVLQRAWGGGRGGASAVTAATDGVAALDGYYGRFIPARWAAATAPLLLIAAVAFASPTAAGILLFTLIPFAAGMALAGMAAADESRRQFEALERLSGLFLDRIRALPAILAFQAETRMVEDVAAASTDLERRTGRVLRVAFLSSAVLEFFSALSVALVAVYCGFNLLRLLPFPAPEQLDLGRAIFVLALAPEVYAPMRRLAAAYHDRQAAEAAAPTLRGATDAPSPRPRPVLSRPPVIRFQDVAIAYEGGPAVIAGVSLTAAPGRFIALCGSSGVGKSSLLHALLGLAPVSAGSITIDGEPLPAGGLGGAVAWAGQTPFILPGTLGDNIAAARPDASLRQIMAAAAAAGLHGDLDRPLDERGGGLSGGERRRLGLARAFLSSSPLLLLDEPTANLDGASEQRMIAAIRTAARGRTTLCATHSDAVLEIADLVVRL